MLESRFELSWLRRAVSARVTLFVFVCVALWLACAGLGKPCFAQQPSQGGQPGGAAMAPSGDNSKMPMLNAAKGAPDSEPPARGATTNAGRGGMTSLVFCLAVALWLFGYFLFTNYGINNRIRRLEEAVRNGVGGTRERDELVPFSWNSVLRSLTDGFVLLPGLRLRRPGLVLLGVDGGVELRGNVVSNVAYNVMQDPELVVLCVTHEFGVDDVGRRILSIEAGSDWRKLEHREREDALQKCNHKLECYERSLYCMSDLVLTPRQLYNTCQEVLKDGDIGAIITDGLDVFVGEEDDSLEVLLEQLRLVAARCHVPVCVVVPEDSDTWNKLSYREIWSAVASLRADQDSSVLRGDFSVFPGALPEVSWLYNRESGAILAKDATRVE